MRVRQSARDEDDDEDDDDSGEFFDQPTEPNGLTVIAGIFTSVVLLGASLCLLSALLGATARIYRWASGD